MADSLKLDLTFHEPIDVADGKKDCGIRTVILPLSLPALGNDFVWDARDFDGFRMIMLEEMAARFPERTQWTPADLEVVLVEVLAWALDQLSDMLDRVTAEAYLETARRPQSVRRLLNLFGCGNNDGTDGDDANDADEREWSKNPVSMEAARRAGPKSVHRQNRMVSVDDYAEGMKLHPLVRRAVSRSCWSGSWHCILVTVILWGWQRLDRTLVEVFEELPTFEAQVKKFHKQHGLPDITDKTSIRDSLGAWSDLRRMVGQEVLFGEATRVGINIRLDIRVAPQYYRSEVIQAVRTVFNAQEGGFFEIGRLSFGTDLNKSDVIQTVMQIEGIASVEVNTFKRFDSNSKEPEDSIVLEGVEVAVCENNPRTPELGTLVIQCREGLVG